MFEEHIYCIINDIHIPFTMGILKYAERVHEMFEMEILLPPPSRKNYNCDESGWDIRDITYKDDVICKVFKDRLTEVMQKEVKGEFYDNYCTIPP